jgi:hypothetical protein
MEKTGDPKISCMVPLRSGRREPHENLSVPHPVRGKRNLSALPGTSVWMRPDVLHSDNIFVYCIKGILNVGDVFYLSLQRALRKKKKKYSGKHYFCIATSLRIHTGFLECRRLYVTEAQDVGINIIATFGWSVCKTVMYAWPRRCVYCSSLSNICIVSLLQTILDEFGRKVGDHSLK